MISRVFFDRRRAPPWLRSTVSGGRAGNDFLSGIANMAILARTNLEHWGFRCYMWITGPALAIAPAVMCARAYRVGPRTDVRPFGRSRKIEPSRGVEAAAI